MATFELIVFCICGGQFRINLFSVGVVVGQSRIDLAEGKMRIRLRDLFSTPALLVQRGYSMDRDTRPVDANSPPQTSGVFTSMVSSVVGMIFPSQ